MIVRHGLRADLPSRRGRSGSQEYGISRWIRRRTAEELDVQDAALYQALRRLEKKGWVEAEWGRTDTNRRARFYTLTSRGRKQLDRELTTWRRYTAAMARVLAPVQGEA